MNDEKTTMNELKNKMAKFVHERDWTQFHSPKNLSMSIMIEAAELMEKFQWMSVEDLSALLPVKLQLLKNGTQLKR